MSLRVRLTLWGGAVTVAVLVVLMTVAFLATRDLVSQGVQIEMLRLTRLRAQALRQEVEHAGLFLPSDYFLLDRSGTVLVPPSREDLPLLQDALRRGRLRPETAGITVVRAADPVWFATQPMAEGITVGLVRTRSGALAELDLWREDVILVAAAGALTLVVLLWLIAAGVTRPLILLSQAADRVAGGDLDAPVPRTPHDDEIGVLARSFARMQADLKARIRQLRMAEAERQRAETELAIGSRIQRTFLPEMPPGESVPLMGGRLRVAAWFQPARQMSGDLYDFFPLGADRLGIAVGDVSGKGLPAALMMAVTHTLLRPLAQRSAGPGECLAQVNRLIMDENRSDLFVTLHFGIVDLAEGALRFANAGHLAPLVLRSDGEALLAGLPDGLVLGVLEGAEFGEAVVPLHPGDTVVLVTDGVTEAEDGRRRLFGEERLLEVVRGSPAPDPAGLLLRIARRLEEYRGGRDPEDDLTMLALRVEGP